jgi:hypothetical protein
MRLTQYVDWPVDRYAQALHAKTAALKIGVVRRAFFDQLDAQVEAAINSALSHRQALAEFGMPTSLIRTARGGRGSVRVSTPC